MRARYPLPCQLKINIGEAQVKQLSSVRYEYNWHERCTQRSGISG